jgi:nucleotide-binding universal stress UspA family protein
LLLETCVKILLAVDDSEASLQACRLVAGYAGDRSTHEVMLVNVQPLPVHLSAQPGVPPSVLDSALREDGRRQLERAQGLLQAAGWHADSTVLLGPAAGLLVETALESRADVLVLGAGRQGMLRGYALGSVALRVAPAAHCPVVLVKPRATLPLALGIRLRMAVPVDGSQQATEAVRRLARCAHLLGELHVDLLHFGPGLSLAGAILPPHDDVLLNWSGRDSDAVIAEPAAILSAAGITHDVHLLHGNPAAGIVAFAREHRADLIAMGSRGMGAVHHLVLGSVALTTAQLSDVPVAIMR